MSSANLSVRPDLCDNCGRCVPACPRGELRVGGGYIYVDASTCDGCMQCVAACNTGAISVRAGRGSAAGLAVQPGDVSHVVVSSRAEAKALRKAAEAAASKPAMRKKASATAGAAAQKRQGAAASSKPRPAADSAPAQRRAAGTRSESASAASPKPRAAAAHGADGARWGVIDAATVAGVLLASLLAKEAVLGSTVFGVMPASGRALGRAGVLAVFYAIQIALAAFLAHRRGMTLPEAFRLKLGEGDFTAAAKSVGLVAALLLGTRLVSTLWGALAQAVGWAPAASEALSGIFGGGSLGFVLTVLTVVVVGPLVEEMVFRGVIAGALDLRFGMWVAITTSAAAFAAYHLTAWVAVPTFVLGVALAWLALTRETLWPAVALHALYNGVVVAAVFWLPVR
ncbi:MAG TPA: CPBP family glutamic-type intramembrane protease [Coriobacteriia bacterium]|nr:CPBP family glutamic-type intramembrane protease [Coriobacteriia bacterium]